MATQAQKQSFIGLAAYKGGLHCKVLAINKALRKFVFMLTV